MNTRSTMKAARGFTLIEILLASAAAALIFIAVYGVFVQAIHLRDKATNRVRNTRLQARAERAIRNDLNNALISGGLLASSLTGGSNSSSGPGGAGLPGYLKLTTTNGKDTSANAYGDVQQVEYYLVPDAAGAASAANGGTQGGTLVRAVTRDLLATAQPSPTEEKILSGVQSLQVQFYDGTNWQDSWTYDASAAAAAGSAATSAGTTSTVSTTSNTTLPLAIRVDVQSVAATPDGNPPPPIEILVPWMTQPFAAATPDPNASGGSGGGSATPGTNNNNNNNNNGPGNNPTGPGRGGPPGGEGPGGGGPPGGGGGGPPGGGGPGGPPRGGPGR